MEEILKTIEQHRKILKDFIQIKTNEKKQTFRIRRYTRKRKYVPVLIFFTVFLTLAIATGNEKVYALAFAILAIGCLVCSIATPSITVDLINKTYAIKGWGAWKRRYNLDDYIGSEIQYSIKDFPERFYLRFNAPKGEKKHNIADLNISHPKRIPQRQEVIQAIWESIISQMTQQDQSSIDQIQA